MKNGLLALLITVYALNALSQVVPDTTNITIGDKTIIVIDSNPTKQQPPVVSESPDVPSVFAEEDRKLEMTHFAGIDVGFSRLIETNNTHRDSATDWLSLNPNASWSWRLNLLEQKIRLYRDYIGLTTGMSVVYNSYGFQNNIDLSFNDSLSTVGVFVDPAVRNYHKNKLRTTSIQIPLLLELNSSSNPDKHFHLAFGVQGGWVTTSIHKQKWENDLGRFTSRRRDDFHVEPFSLDIAIRLGYNRTLFFLNYGLTPLFEESVRRKVIPIVFGFQLLQF